MFQNKFTAVFVALLLVGFFVVQDHAWGAEVRPTLKSGAFAQLEIDGLLLSEDEMDDVTGELGKIIVGAALSYVAYEVADYYGVDDWLQETAIPAVESAVVSAYESTVDFFSDTFEMIGEAWMDYSSAWMW